MEEGGRGQLATSGRKPRQLLFARDFGQIITVDLGGSTLRAAVVNLDGEILARSQTPVEPRRLERQLGEVVAQMLKHPRALRPLSVGIGVAGTVDQASGLVYDAPALQRSRWNVTAFLRPVTRLPIVLDNDVNLAGLGEQWRWAARGRRYVACLSGGTGIGAAFIIDGHLYRGARGLAGEAGHLYHRPEMPPHPFDTFGDLELQAAGFGIARRGSISPDGHDARPVFRATERGDPASAAIIDHAATQIGIAVGNIISLFDPEVVALLGGIGLGQVDLILPRVQQVIRRITPPGSRDQVAIVPGELGDNAVLVGAACAGQRTLGLA